ELSDEIETEECVSSSSDSSSSASNSDESNNSNWNWTESDNNPVIRPFTDNSGVCENLLNKFGSDPPSELSILSEFMEPLFDKICNETNTYAVKQQNNSDRKKLKDDDKWFDTTEIRKIVLKNHVVFATLEVKEVKLYGSNGFLSNRAASDHGWGKYIA
ncbi:hypothetical protein C0J52_18175, partial [Blattella germanica]